MDKSKKAGDGDSVKSFKGEFRPSRKRLKEIGKKGFEQMEKLDPKDIDIGDFKEEPDRK